MAKYKAYPEYKDSGVEWLGEIPVHWKSNALKNICRIINGSTPKSGVEEFWDGEINWITPTDLSQKSGKIVTESIRKITLAGLNSCGATLVSRDSVIISTRAPIGSLAITSIESCTNQGCKSLVTNDAILSKFIYYFLSTITTPINILGKGSTFLELSTEDLSTVRVPQPNGEINEIISFLDKETTKIDNLIGKQQQLIELLKEKRQAVISHAVTKGLNPDVPMKDSGVEWLGIVPSSWTISKFAYVKEVLTDYTANGSFADLKANVNYKDEISFARLVRLTDLRKNLENVDGVWIDEKAYKYLNKSSLFGGEFLLANVGAYAGIFYQMPYNKGFASLAPNMFMAKFNKSKVSSEFMSIIGQSHYIYEQLKLKATASSAQPKINKYDFKSIVFSYPNLQEQNKIAAHIKTKISTIDGIVTAVNNFLDLLKERRTALISAAVTGKIDVRNWRAPNEHSQTTAEAETAL